MIDIRIRLAIGLCMSFKGVNRYGLKQLERNNRDKENSCVCHSKK